MAVAKETIINKMIQELAAAKATEKNEQQMKQHIASVRLLCDLLLEEQTNDKENVYVESVAEFSEAELKTMIGNNAKPKTFKKVERSDHGEANGDSIFDF